MSQTKLSPTPVKKNQFQLKSSYQPTGDQPQAISQLSAQISKGKNHQVLLGVTGSGKTFSVANLIQNTQKPTLVIAHNKTLAAQLYQEFSYFVSYYDYYQPEAYLPTTDTYIEKEAQINDEIDKLRLAATTNLLTRPDVIVVASVSCIYNLGSPVEYGNYIFEMIEGELISRESLLLQLTELQYERNDTEFKRGSFRLRGDTIQVWPAYQDTALQIETLENKIEKIKEIDPLSGVAIQQVKEQQAIRDHQGRYIIYPAKHYLVDPQTQAQAFAQIEQDLKVRLDQLKTAGKELEAFRLKKKVNYDLEMIREFGFVNGIENYSRYFDGRQPGQPPYTLLDYFQENVKRFGHDSFLTIIDESHMTAPQIRGMYHGDRSRKQTLIEYGFRLPSALDNRPLNFPEFMSKTQQNLYVSATPADWEIKQSGGEKTIVEQLIRPTGLLDPLVQLRPSKNQIQDLIIEIMLRVQQNQRILVTTLTKKMSEVLTEYLNNPKKIKKLVKDFVQSQTKDSSIPTQKTTKSIQSSYLPINSMSSGKIKKKFYTPARPNPQQIQQLKRTIKNNQNLPKVAYLHSEIETLERSDILDDLRQGKYDVLVGINLLREGLDLPEVSLVAILDADKTGFLRSETALIQTMGRAARHQAGLAILYADQLSQPMQAAIQETQRRRQIQEKFNQEHDIIPTSIKKPIREKLLKQKKKKSGEQASVGSQQFVQLSKDECLDLNKINPSALTPQDAKQLSKKLTRRMRQAAREMDFELAASLRDKIQELT